MPFIEHDLKTLLADMPHPFLQSEVKTIMTQLLSAVAHCHANWIVSRRSENLMSNRLMNTATSRPQNLKSADEQSRTDQGRRLWISEKVW